MANQDEDQNCPPTKKLRIIANDENDAVDVIAATNTVATGASVGAVAASDTIDCIEAGTAANADADNADAGIAANVITAPFATTTEAIAGPSTSAAAQIEIVASVDETDGNTIIRAANNVISSGPCSHTISFSSAAATATDRPRNLKLIDLNEDCIVAIFRYLPLLDLNAIGLTCHHFNRLATTVYAYHNKFKQFNVAKMAGRYECDFRLSDGVDAIKQYLKKFGHLIDHVDFNNNIFDRHSMPNATKEIFTFITVYGLGILKSLRMRHMDLDEVAISRAHLIFNHLLKLNVDDRLNWTEIFPMCLKLQELSIKYNAYGYPLDLEYKFDKLKVFKLKVYHRMHPIAPPAEQGNQVIQPYSLELRKFLMYHINLTVLSINVTSTFDFAIIGLQKQLEELSLYMEQPRIEHSYTHPDIRSIYSLTNLRKIHINDYSPVIFRDFLLKSMSIDTLEHLTVERCVMDQSFVEGISRFHNLQYLKLVLHTIHDNIPNGVWQKLQQLHRITELSVSGDFQNISRFVHSMTGNNETLLRLTIVRCSFDRLFIVGLAQLVKLQYLYIDVTATTNQLNVPPPHFGAIQFGFHGHGHAHGHALVHGQPPMAVEQNAANAPPNSITPADWQQLQQLANVRELTMNTMSGCAKLFLQNLGCRVSLEKFEIHRFYADTEMLTAIKRFTNLKVLKLDHAIRFNRNHLLELIDDNRNEVAGLPVALHRIEEFHFHGQERLEDQHHMDFIFLGEHYSYITNQFIVRLVKHWPTLKRLTWIGNLNSDINKAVKLNAKLYMELVQICRDGDRKLVVDIRPNPVTVPPCMYTKERHLVEIGMNYDGHFNGN